MPEMRTRSINAARQAVTRARHWAKKDCPSGGQVVVPSAQLDRPVPHSKGLTLKKIVATLDAGASGNLVGVLELFEQMEQQDPSLASVANTRRTALTGLPWEIISAADIADVGEDQELADDAADFIRSELSGLQNLTPTLEHLSNAIGSNLSIAELVWERCELIDIVAVPSSRLRMDPQEIDQVNVRIDGDHVGIPARSPKFVRHQPRAACGYPLGPSLLHSQAIVWHAKRLAFSDWATFCELFGMPVRVGKYPQGVSEKEKRDLARWLEALGSNAWAMMSSNCSIDLVERTGSGAAPYKEFIDWLDRSQAKVWLGGNLTSDTTGGTGTFAAADVHDDVRKDLRDDDIEKESRTVTNQIIAPMVGFKFNREVPLPVFRRKKPETIDRLQEADLFAKAQRAGIDIPRAYAYGRLGIPEPKRDERGHLAEEVLSPPDPFSAGVAESI